MLKTQLIKNILTTSFLNKEGHIGSSLSILDILISLYDNVMTENDTFILSKGHASLAIYAILLEKELISKEEFFGFCSFHSRLGGHPSSQKIKEIKISTGSLGHGLPFALGLALSKKIKKENGNIYCLIGDGEANEGTIWESALLAGSLELNNLVCIMDFNKSGERAVKLKSGIDKFDSFGWSVNEVDGHNQSDVFNILNVDTVKPYFIQANTIKGKGCKIMENNPEWHHKCPSSQEELDKLIADIYE